MVDIQSATAEIRREKKETSGYATWFTAGGAICELQNP